MSKLEWCRANAPDALKDLPDVELLEYMSDAYERLCEDTCQGVTIEEDDLLTHSNQLDYMFKQLVYEFGDNLTFKGGYMLSKILNAGLSRQTEDIDFSILTDEIYDNIKTKLEEIGDFFIAKGIVARYKIKPTVEPRTSGGVKFYDSTGKSILGVDVGWHDTTYCITNYSINSIDCKGFKPERMVGDKLLSIMSRKRFRRAKDLYDLYIISQECDLNLTEIHACMAKRKDIHTLWINWPFNETVLREYGKAYNKLRITTISGKNVNTVPYEVAYSRLSQLVEAIKVSVPRQTHVWDCKKGMVCSIDEYERKRV